MNERIDKLFGQALDEAVPETWTTLDADQLNRLKCKFAELIVRECVETLGTYEDYWNHYEQMEMLKKHFGVKE